MTINEEDYAGLYVHVPFCASKCNYCNFYSVAPANIPDENEYLQALERELIALPQPFQPRTVFIGGGTPTILPLDELQQMLTTLKDNVDFASVSEFSVEANPGTLTKDKTGLLQSAGVDRFSLGVQSFDDDVLRLLGRTHSVEDVEQCWEMLKDADAINRSMDIMFGVPGTDMGIVENDLGFIASMQPEHVSAYCLSIEEGTPLHFQYESGFLDALEEDSILEQYEFIRGKLKSLGYHHYEISNFAREGFECRHNLLYWSGGGYIGCGPAAHSHWNGVRYSNVANLWQYTRLLLAGNSPRDMEEHLSDEEKARETLIMSLRRVDGFVIDNFERETGFDLRSLCGEELDKLIGEEMLVEESGRLRLSEGALFVSDAVFRRLV